MSGLTEKREYHNTGKLKSVYFVDENGSKQGICKEYDFEGILVVEAEYKDNKLDGTHKRYISEKGVVLGVEEEAEYSDGKLNGSKKFYNDYGAVRREEIYENGFLIRQKEINRVNMVYKKDGKEFSGHVEVYETDLREDGDRECISRYSLTDGVYDGYYYNKEEGVYANYEKGVLHGDYSDDKRQGYYVNGVFSGGVFNGEKVSTFFKPDGVRGVESWADGELRNVHIEMVNDQEKYEAMIRHNGKCWEFIRNGNESHEIEYTRKNGKIDGVMKELHPDGWVIKSTEYEKGKPHGASIEYNSDGTIASKRIFRDGVDITDNLERLKRVAKGNVSKEQGVVLPKRSKLSKIMAVLKDRLKGGNSVQ